METGVMQRFRGMLTNSRKTNVDFTSRLPSTIIKSQRRTTIIIPSTVIEPTKSVRFFRGNDFSHILRIMNSKEAFQSTFLALSFQGSPGTEIDESRGGVVY